MFKFSNFILSILFFLIPFTTQAADRDEYWLQRDISIGQGRNDYGKKVYGQSARSIMQNVTIENSTKEEVRQLIKRSIAVDKPTPAKVGGSMLKRLYSPQAIVGTAAVSGLLAAIGWVMEDGVYVKKYDVEIDPDDPSIFKYRWRWDLNDSTYDCYSTSHCKSVGNLYVNKVLNIYETTSCSMNGTYMTCYYKEKKSGSVYNWTMQRFANDKYDPNKKPETKTAILTSALLGAAMLGTGYNDPDPNFDNDRVNTDDYTGVKEIYEHDPSGVGDEVADAMDDKMKNAKPTDDGKSSWIGDPRYTDEPTDENDTSQDRSWTDSGDEATGVTTPTVDPETGEQTGGSSITIQFPVFCSWAAKMCQWYDDWKKTDDWVKDESDLPEKDDTDLNITTDFEEKKVSLNVSAQCPAPTYETVVLHGVTSQVKTSDYSFICSLDWLIKPFVIGFSMVTACFILLGFQRGGDD